MVKALSSTDWIGIDDAAHAVEQRTGCAVRVVIVPQSAPYREALLLCGFVLGSTSATALSFYLPAGGGPIAALETVTCQLMVMALANLRPFSRFLLKGLPSVVKRRQAERRAYARYHALHAAVPANQKFLLLFVSLTERYVHVMTNPALHKEHPENWDQVTSLFAAVMKQNGLKGACLAALDAINKKLAG